MKSFIKFNLGLMKSPFKCGSGSCCCVTESRYTFSHCLFGNPAAVADTPVGFGSTSNRK